VVPARLRGGLFCPPDQFHVALKKSFPLSAAL
jgi:hypothetical protein